MTSWRSQFPVAPLQHDVEVLIDPWGVPHIYAESISDAFVAQGFQAARDRLFQIDAWRRRGLGQLAEVLGPDYLAQDRATRLFLFRGDMHAEWQAYGGGAQEAVTAFVEGVNSYVLWVLADPDNRLAPEFQKLGYLPSRWRPEDVVRIRTHGLFSNVEQELARALTLRDLGAQAEDLRAVREPDDPLDALLGFTYDFLSEEVLDDYRLAFAPVVFEGERFGEGGVLSGSNNWVISPSRSASGRPILGNDPHRVITVPSLRYLVHLEAPGLSVIGAGEPHLPGVSIGHNGHVAFGLTIFPIDQEDLYVYELHPQDDRLYRYDGSWEPFETVEERFGVLGGDDVTRKLRYTRHGPVTHCDTQARRAVAVRAAWLEPGMVPYLASLAFQNAQTCEEFVTALDSWGAPGVNMVFAGSGGDIGWKPVGRVPQRRGWSGSLPVQGDGRFEWNGHAASAELPLTLNPECGWITTSNQFNLPRDALHVTSDWYSSARHERLTAWLAKDDQVDVRTSVDMQMDVINHHGRRILDALAVLPNPPAHWREWLELQAWSGKETTESRAALIFQVWHRRHFRRRLVDICLERLGVGRESAAARRRLFRHDTLFSDLRPDLRMLDMLDLNDEQRREQFVVEIDETLGAALAELESLLGPDRSGWTWGALHRAELRHPVFYRAADVPAHWGALPPVARPGSGDTVGLAGHDESFNALVGSSFRMTVDVGEWDRSQVVNCPGQSGDPRSPHYADLLGLWASGESFPLLFTREAVKASTREWIMLHAPVTDAL